MKQGLVRLLYNFGKRFMGWTLHMIMCVLLCYPVSIRIYYQQGVVFLVYFGFYVAFNTTGYITTGSWKGRGNQYIQLVRVLYCKLPTNSKQLPAFPLEAVTGIEP